MKKITQLHHIYAETQTSVASASFPTFEMMNKEIVVGKMKVNNAKNKSFSDKEHKHIVLAAVSLNVVCVCFVY